MGRDVDGNLDGAEQILRISREGSAPDAADPIFRGMAQFTHPERAGQNTDTYITEFEKLREKAESRMLGGSGFPAAFVSALCMQNAALPKNEKPRRCED